MHGGGVVVSGTAPRRVGDGSTFPFHTRAALNDAVVGRQVAPGPLECVTVAGLLVTAAAVVRISYRRHRPLSRSAAFAVAFVFAIRAAFGFGGRQGRTSKLVPGSESPRSSAWTGGSTNPCARGWRPVRSPWRDRCVVSCPRPAFGERGCAGAGWSIRGAGALTAEAPQWARRRARSGHPRDPGTHRPSSASSSRRRARGAPRAGRH